MEALFAGETFLADAYPVGEKWFTFNGEAASQFQPSVLMANKRDYKRHLCAKYDSKTVVWLRKYFVKVSAVIFHH